LYLKPSFWKENSIDGLLSEFEKRSDFTGERTKSEKTAILPKNCLFS
jgi:hypothetical protein